MNIQFNTFFKLRSRTVWEAADSGLLLWRTNFFALIAVYAVVPVTIAVLCALVPVSINFYLVLFIIWWFKPFYERFVLHIVQLKFFNKQINRKTFFNGLVKTCFKSILSDLSWRRFSPMRGSLVCLRVLEGLKHNDIKTRKKMLEKGGINFCVPVTFFCAFMEIVLYAGEFIFIIITSSIANLDSLNVIQGEHKFLIYLIPYLFNMTIVGSMYVCSSFALYINSRVLVEGWDLQLLFNKDNQK